jgi:hypothetical protein
MAAEMTVKEKLELEALGVFLGEGPWQYRRQDLDHARQVCLNLQADPEYAKIEGGVEIEPPRWSLDEDWFYDPFPVFKARYKVGLLYCEAQFPSSFVYDDSYDHKIEIGVWRQYPDLYPALLYPDGPPEPIDPIDPIDPVDPIDPIKPVNPVQPNPVEPLRLGFQVDPKIYI